MASLAAKKTASGQAQPSTKSGNRTQMQRSLSRRVSFNESTLKQSSGLVPDIEGQTNNPSKRTSSRFNMCCAWTSLAIGIVIIIILVAGTIVFCFFQSNLPDFHFEGLYVKYIGTVKGPNGDTLLNADIQVTLNATNLNEKMPVYYGSLTASLESRGVFLGKLRLPEIFITPNNFTALNLDSVINNATVLDSDAKDLIYKSQYHQLLINLVLEGKIHFVIGGKKMAGFPVKVLCNDVYQGDLDNGLTPKCNVKMTPVS